MWQPAFWRGSDDCVHWSGWLPVLGDPAKWRVAPFRFYQARILINGEWRTSAIGESDG